jgi:hypothetical protein
VSADADSLTFRPNRRGTLITLVILGVLTAGLAAAAVVFHWLIWILVVASACGLAAVGFAALPGRSYLRLDPHGFEIKTPFRARRFAWADVTPFVAVPLSYAAVVAFRARSAPGADLPPTPEPTAADVAAGAEALPQTYGHDADDLAATMNRWRARSLG